MKRRYSAKVGNRVFSFGGRMRKKEEVAEADEILRSPAALAILRKLVEGLEIGMDLSGKPNFGQKGNKSTPEPVLDARKRRQQDALISLWGNKEIAIKASDNGSVVAGYFGGDA